MDLIRDGETVVVCRHGGGCGHATGCVVSPLQWFLFLYYNLMWNFRVRCTGGGTVGVGSLLVCGRDGAVLGSCEGDQWGRSLGKGERGKCAVTRRLEVLVVGRVNEIEVLLRTREKRKNYTTSYSSHAVQSPLLGICPI